MVIRLGAGRAGVQIYCVWSFEEESETQWKHYNNNIYLLQLGCQPVAVVILHVYKILNWLLINLSREGYMRSM